MIAGDATVINQEPENRGLKIPIGITNIPLTYKLNLNSSFKWFQLVKTTLKNKGKAPD